MFDLLSYLAPCFSLKWVFLFLNLQTEFQRKILWFDLFTTKILMLLSIKFFILPWLFPYSFGSSSSSGFFSFLVLWWTCGRNNHISFLATFWYSSSYRKLCWYWLKRRFYDFLIFFFLFTEKKGILNKMIAIYTNPLPHFW